MKIFDCFMYFDEDVLLDLRFNYLNNYVDKFVIVESKYAHNGKKRSLNFDINNFEKFKHKIVYLVLDKETPGIANFDDKDHIDITNSKYFLNASRRENFQRNYITEGLKDAEPDDIILISDLDEIPNLEQNNLKNIKNKLIFFKQKLFYYKFNLKLESFEWFGTKACRKNDLLSPQWLRNIKDKKFGFYRIDTFFSETKYRNLSIIENGGWHYTNIKTAEEILHKLKSYLHHQEFDENPLSLEQIEKIIQNKTAIYNLGVDQRQNKFGSGPKLTKIEKNEMPEYLKNNSDIFSKWLD